MNKDKHLAPDHYDFTGLASAELRASAAHDDADIEGLAQDQEMTALIQQWTDESVSLAEQRQRIIAHYAKPAFEAAQMI